MSDKEKIKTLLKEGALYRKQSLLKQSKEKYMEALQIIDQNQQLANRAELINAVQEKLRTVEKEFIEVEETALTEELSESQIHLIRKRFAFSENKETAAMEGALALAKFGQYEQALEEFHRLLKEGTMPVVAAKNIITCYLSFATPEAAIAQFGQWVSRKSLSTAQLNQLRVFIKNLLEKRGIKATLPQVRKAPAGKGMDEEEEEGVIDLSSVSIQLKDGPLKGESVELDVTFQSDNNIGIVVSADREDLLHSFKTGKKLTDIQCYSPIGFFTADGIILGKTHMKDGPRQGDYLVDITIDAD